jgi:hypothetical protein
LKNDFDGLEEEIHFINFEYTTSEIRQKDIAEKIEEVSITVKSRILDVLAKLLDIKKQFEELKCCSDEEFSQITNLIKRYSSETEILLLEYSKELEIFKSLDSEASKLEEKLESQEKEIQMESKKYLSILSSFTESQIGRSNLNH